MRFTLSASLLALAALVAAQDTTIQVGFNGTSSGFFFNPPAINATAGSVVTFNFSGVPGNHTVAQSSFASPCEQMQGGFDSGFIQVPEAPSSPADFPTWNLTITNQSTPLWFFCAQVLPSPHCFVGMVGSINAPASGHSFEAFQSAAEALSSSGSTVAIPSPNLIGVGAQATAAPGPFSGSITGFAAPSGTAPAPSISSSGASSSGSGTSPSSSTSPSPSTTNAASSVGANGFVVFVAALFGIAML